MVVANSHCVGDEFTNFPALAKISVELNSGCQSSFIIPSNSKDVKDSGLVQTNGHKYWSLAAKQKNDRGSQMKYFLSANISAGKPALGKLKLISYSLAGSAD